MAYKPSTSPVKPLTLPLIFFSLILFFLSIAYHAKLHLNCISQFHSESFQVSFSKEIRPPKWYEVLARSFNYKKMKIGFISMKGDDGVYGDSETINIHFQHVAKEIQWSDLFPEWIDESLPLDSPKCPEIPMPTNIDQYNDLDVIVTRLPCEGGSLKRLYRDVFRLQVNLVVANLLVRSGWRKHQQGFGRLVYAVFIGSCGPMKEIFRCDDLLWSEGNFWIYKPNLVRLKEKVLMPVGTCQLARPVGEPDQELQKRFGSARPHNGYTKSKEAYVTVIHSSEDYVCGAITLAQSIILSNSTKDLVILVDNSVSAKSLQGLKAAGWKIKQIRRIRSPHAQRKAYNEWNYSKLRIWQLEEYDKVIFIDADLLVLKNLDGFFQYPQLSAVGNSRHVFNSGVMLVEPSKCTFKTFMEQRFKVPSYNGGDQGFLNEMFMWWHRWPSKLNHLKNFNDASDKVHKIPKDIYALHYLGLKPWMCEQDYDCNWDILEMQRFASDTAHKKWWQVYKAMPDNLKPYCELAPQAVAKIRKFREQGRKNASFVDKHWRVKGSRRHYP